MHEHIYSLFITVERLLPELGTPKAHFECACGSKLSIDKGLAIINAAQQSVQLPYSESKTKNGGLSVIVLKG